MVLTPGPLSLRERGNDGTASESLAQERLQALACHISIADADDAVAGSLEHPDAGSIVGLLTAPLMHVALQLKDDPLGDATEVNDEAVHDVLAAEL